ncbi:hypothetical protein RHGRI_001911 [Rhododendron griersonianum]|uniref:ATP-dependent DNA helicase n=1 Tax=Rhododendron griersonianum TaxID=479676 RepID=A0AAV6LMJ1_9ERIC|nr:hypothetical protein RHGRI_001911 [Rhododendron griersonianum]
MGVMRRTDGSTGIDTTTLEGLQSMLNVTNPYAQVFRSAGDIIRDNGAQDLRVRILSSRGGRQYTKPNTNEIAALLVGDGFESGANHDIVVQKLDGHLHRINETHPAYMPLQYPILFPYGTDGWKRSIEFTQATNANREGVSMLEFYAFRLQFRDSEGKTLLQGGRLFQQFVVDCYAAIEQDRLNFVRCNQNILRSDLYSGLRDAVTAGDADAAEVGTRFILPSSFTGGPRNMNQHYQDAMAVCRAMGFLDLLLTFTCNPSWSEIQQEVSRIPNQRTEYRPDILARVFQIKMKQLMRDIKKEKFFGKIIADIYVIEYQKRGLPHSHIILTLAAEDKLNSPEEIDEVICAEIPDEVNDPSAFETIMRCMIHGPCGDGNLSAPCMVNGKCSKHYPKTFSEQTTVDQNGFVIYRRRNYGKKYTVNGVEIDNRWVIPYNRDLIVKYNAHINLERCVHTKLIKYLYKYMHKGPDRATVVLENNVARTTGGGQCSYSMTDEIRGAKCYEDVRTVNGVVYPTYKAACIALGLLDDDNEWGAALTEASTWASGSQLRNLFCSMLMFSEVTNPLELWENHWVDLTDDLQNRVRRLTGDVNLSLRECDLKNLGLVEIENILNQNGRSLREFSPMPLPSSREAEIVSNRLIREELQYDSTFELQSFQSLHGGLNDDQLKVFNTIVEAYDSRRGGLFFVYGSGGTGKTYLWKSLIAKFRAENKIVLAVASSGIAALLLPGGRTAHSHFKIPLNPDEFSCCSINLRTKLARLIQEASLIIWDEAPMISRYAFEAVDRTFRDILKSTVHCSRSRLFGGKLFVLSGDFRQILPVVTKGSREQTVAASLPNSTIWDHCRVLHLTRNMRLTAQDIPDQTRQELRDFAEWIKLIGEGKIQGTSFSEGRESNWIQIPERFLIRNGERSLHMLIESTYPDFTNKYQDIGYLQERAILAPKHDDVDEINNIMLSMLPGEMRIYNSADKLCPTEHESNDQDMHPPELLHSLNFPGLPNHCLKLKVGTPIILLRNVNLSLGLCNGTRLIVVKMGNQVIEAKVVTGSRAREIVHLHRAVLSPSSTHSPFTMKRRQFPIKLAFSMTINKSQGQTLKNVGLYLPNSCFSHGQL